MTPSTTEIPDRLALSDRRYRMIFDHSRDGIYFSGEGGRFLDVNPAMLDLLGFTRRELLELSLQELCEEPGDRERLDEALAQRESVRALRVRLRRKGGGSVACLLTAEVDGSGDGGHHGVLSAASVRELEADDRMRPSTLHDPLTQLPNRAYFVQRADRLLERRHHRADFRFGILCVDLDRFKLVNDSLGRRAGDELLVLIAERLSALVRPEDIVARFGGNEFAVLFVDLPGQAEAELVAGRVCDGLREVFDVHGHEVYVSASVGIVLSSERYEAADEMIRDAATAMDAGKKGGAPAGWVMFDEGMRTRTVVRFATEMALRGAVERQEFVVHYQPLVAIDSRHIVGFEALLRWDHPERGLILPDEFLPVAEETGLIVPIGHWVLSESCRRAAEWRELLGAEDPSLLMAVNMSARQLLVPGLAGEVRTVLEETGLPGEALRLEITETVFLASSGQVRDTLSELHGLGVRLCLDDFGTGYSSLGYLRDLPVSLLKIDRGFVSRLSELPDGGVGDVVETILALAARLDVLAVAEGVETQAQLDFLAKLGCGLFQGYLFSRPVAGEDARALLLKDRQGTPWFPA